MATLHLFDTYAFGTGCASGVLGAFRSLAVGLAHLPVMDGKADAGNPTARPQLRLIEQVLSLSELCAHLQVRSCVPGSPAPLAPTLSDAGDGRVETSTAVVREMQEQGVLVFAGGLVEELEESASADARSGELVFTDGPFSETKEWLGGLAIVEVPDDESARMWAGKVAEGCGWPQQVRRFKAGSLQAMMLGG